MRTEPDALLSLQRAVAAALPDFVEVLTEVESERAERPYAVVTVDNDWTPDPSTSHPEITLPVTIYAYVRGETRAAARAAAESAREAIWLALGVGGRDNAERLLPLFDYTGKPAVQRVQLARAVAGTFALALGAQVSAPIAARAQPQAVRLAVEPLRPDFAGNVWVFGRRGGPWDIRWDNDLRGRPIPTLSIDTAELAGPGPAGGVTVLSTGDPAPWRSDRDYMRVEAPTFGGMRDPADSRLRTVTVGLRLTWGRLGRVRSGEMRVRQVTVRGT